MLIYRQMTGELFLNGVERLNPLSQSVDPENTDTSKMLLVATGYSGRDTPEYLGRNNPGVQSVPNIGPIPAGHYTIGPVENSEKLGPIVFPLIPNDATETFGRSGFFIHGNDKENDASHGCIVLDRPAREMIDNSGERDLFVIA